MNDRDAAALLQLEAEALAQRGALAQRPDTEEVIQNPPTFGEQAWSAAKSVGREVLPMGGMTLGGALGAVGGGPLGAVGGAGLGYATGKQGNRVLDAIFGGKVPTTIGQQAAEMGGDVATGALYEMLPQILAALGRGGMHAIKGLLGATTATPEDLLVREAADRLGIKLPASSASGSRAVAGLEAVPTNSYFAQSVAEPTLNRVQAQTRGAAENIAASLGPSTSWDSAGTAIQQSLKGAEKATRSQATEMYDAARRLIPADMTVPMQHTATAAQALMDKNARIAGLGRGVGTAERLREAAIPPTIKAASDPLTIQDLPGQLVSQLGLITTRTRTFDELLEIQQRLKSLIRSTPDDYTKRQLGSLVDGVTKDIDVFGQRVGGEAGVALQKANDFYRNEVARHFAEGAPLRKLQEQVNPATIIPGLTIGKVKSEQAIKDVWTRLTPDAQQEMRATLFQDVLKRSIDERTGMFSLQRFLSAKEKVPEHVWETILATDTKAALADLERVFQRVNTMSQWAANPSQTGRAIIGQSQVLGGMASLGAAGWNLSQGDPEGAAKSLGAGLGFLLAPRLFGKAVLSGPGQAFLTSKPPFMQPPASGGAQSGAGLLMRMLGLQLPHLTE